MTALEALYWCEQFTDNIILVDPQRDKKVLALQAMQVCKEALEKQIPKKPLMAGEDYINGRWEVDWECPTCGNPYIDDSFCPCCGQALDWSDTK